MHALWLGPPVLAARYILFVVKLVIYLISYYMLPISLNKDVCLGSGQWWRDL